MNAHTSGESSMRCWSRSFGPRVFCVNSNALSGRCERRRRVRFHAGPRCRERAPFLTLNTLASYDRVGAPCPTVAACETAAAIEFMLISLTHIHLNLNAVLQSVLCCAIDQHAALRSNELRSLEFSTETNCKVN